MVSNHHHTLKQMNISNPLILMSTHATQNDTHYQCAKVEISKIYFSYS